MEARSPSPFNLLLLSSSRERAGTQMQAYFSRASGAFSSPPLALAGKPSSLSSIEGPATQTEEARAGTGHASLSLSLSLAPSSGLRDGRRRKRLVTVLTAETHTSIGSTWRSEAFSVSRLNTEYGHLAWPYNRPASQPASVRLPKQRGMCLLWQTLK